MIYLFILFQIIQISLLGYIGYEFLQQSQEQKNNIEELSKELKVLFGSLAKIGIRINDIEKNSQDFLLKAQLMLEQGQQLDQQSKLYSQAIKLLENGVSIDELIVSCGISRAEAELLASVYCHRKPEAMA
jgi:hypothetical protein